MLKNSATLAIIALCQVNAIKQKYRPPAGSNPWHHDASVPTWERPDWNVNYPVQSYGEDTEMRHTRKNLKLAEKEVGHKMKASFKKPPSHPMNYKVPNFGVDEDVLETQKSLKVAEKENNHKFKGNPFVKPWQPTSFAVPDFGVDEDILNTQNHIQQAEQKLKTKFTASFKKPAQPPRNYFVPNFGVDSDILQTHQSRKAAEKELGHKLYGKSFAQLEVESDPICGSLGCPNNHKKKPLGYPINYPVPSFGADPEIQGTFENIDVAERMYNHKWNFGTPYSKAKWHNPAKDTLYNFKPELDEDVKTTSNSLRVAEDQLGHHWKLASDDYFGQNLQFAAQVGSQSDPICGSGGCISNHKKKPLGYPINYPVPSFGADPDIQGTSENIDIAERMYNHKWQFGTPYSKAKWHNPAKDTMYNFKPEIDEDIKTTSNSLRIAEDQIGHHWKLASDDQFGQNLQFAAQAKSESDPICGSGGCVSNHVKKPLGYPINYPVPSFGADPDISGTAENIDIAERMYNHKWQFGTPYSKAQWHNPAKDTLYNFKPELDQDIKDTHSNLRKTEQRLDHHWQLAAQAESDPICGSGGCVQNHVKKPLGYPINYPVPSFGADPDISGTAENIDIAERMYNHKWQFGTPYSKAQWHNPAKDTLYNFKPELDQDIKDTHSNLKQTERRLDHHWQLAAQAESQSDPICSSAGCWKSKYTLWRDAQKANEVKYPYPVLDSDVKNTLKHEKIASEIVGHKWDYEYDQPALWSNGGYSYKN